MRVSATTAIAGLRVCGFQVSFLLEAPNEVRQCPMALTLIPIFPFLIFRIKFLESNSFRFPQENEKMRRCIMQKEK
ncbi:hypothetical protein ACFX15_032140 [Malus domestica]